jgi:hypothetical protein
VLYDPPELELAEYAEYGALTLEGVERPGEEREGGEELGMVAPPVEWIDSAGHRADALEEFYTGLIDELGRRHFEPHGEDIQQAVSDIFVETDLVKRLQTRMQETETHPYIAVAKDADDDDIVSAARMIRATQAKTLGAGRPATSCSPLNVQLSTATTT